MAADESPQVFQPLPGRTVDRSAEYERLLHQLLDLVGVESPAMDKRGGRRWWRHSARRSIGKAVDIRARSAEETGPVPQEWFDLLIRGGILEPDPSFCRDLVAPAVKAFGRRRVQEALLPVLEFGTPADAAGAARAWYATLAPLRYPAGSKTPTPDSLAEYEAVSDLRARYQVTALRRFVGDDDVDLRCCILPGLRLDPQRFPQKMHGLVARAIHIARTSDVEYLRHRVEVQAATLA